ncbi:putative amino-acid metabolite efflux pump [Blastochloris viridis]|uniref:Putative amino-acid metabolite efflux pump n=1 Tax=Blastochloris viridis TaxID=1079 RepID=A0A0S4Q6R5_BLAVI|nr:putative amino-acid metabolite efflux pump [Blastochloris viridis]
MFGWGTSWYAMKLQVGTVAPEVSVMWRFVLAALVMFAWAALRRLPLRYPPADHARFALLGLLLFSTNFVLFYHGARWLPSGLLSVIFSLSSVGNVLLAAALFGTRIEAKVVGGALLGAGGVALIFWPALAGTRLDAGTAAGLALGVVGTVSFCLGNMVSARLQQYRVPVIAATAWGMAYGVLLLAAASLVAGHSFAIDLSPAYVGSMLWLVGPSSVLAFAAYLTLLGRIGPARAGYVTVLFPLVALAVSTAVEAYVWTLPAIAGVVLVLGGNLLVLTSRRG